MTDDRDRPRGILSSADRQYLRNPDEYSRQAAHERKKAIRERVWNTVLDFGLLSELSRDRRQSILRSNDPEKSEGKPVSHFDLEASLAWMLAFAHQLSTDLGVPVEPNPPHDELKSRTFEIALEEGLGRAYTEDSLVVEDVTLRVDAQHVPGLNRIRNRIEAGRSPSPQTIQYLLETDEIDTAAYLRFLADQLDTTTEWDVDDTDK